MIEGALVGIAEHVREIAHRQVSGGQVVLRHLRAGFIQEFGVGQARELQSSLQRAPVKAELIGEDVDGELAGRDQLSQQ